MHLDLVGVEGDRLHSETPLHTASMHRLALSVRPKPALAVLRAAVAGRYCESSEIRSDADEECLEKFFNRLLGVQYSVLIILDIVPEQNFSRPKIAARSIQPLLDEVPSPLVRRFHTGLPRTCVPDKQGH